MSASKRLFVGCPRRTFHLLLVVELCLLRNARCHFTAVSVFGKPATQSSSHTAGPAGNAIDGDIATFSHTDLRDAHPWWRLDLETSRYLGRITVILRQHCCGEYRFAAAVARAGLSPNYADNQPCGLPATRVQSIDGATVVFLCDPPRMARYVTLDIDPSHPDSTNAFLQLAEVKVDNTTAGGCPRTAGGSFKKLEGRGWTGSPVPLSTTTVRSVLRCTALCMRRDDCKSFDYSSASGQCRLYNLNSADTEPTLNGEISTYVSI